MIKKLRNRLIATIMAFVSVILLVVFADIYIAMYAWANHDMNEILSIVEADIVTSGVQAALDEADAPVIKKSSLNLGVHFSMLVNDAGQLRYIDSTLDARMQDYETAASLALENPDGHIASFLNKKWRYSVETENANARNNAGGLRVICFFDVTDGYKLLDNLMKALCVFYLVLIFVSFVLARFLAARSIRPMVDAWESQRRFIADASHELKTPIATLNANLDILCASPEDVIKNQMQWIDNSKKVIGRMTALVKSMLELAKVDEPHDAHSPFGSPQHGRPAPEAVNINDLIDETMDLYMPRAAGKHIAISEDIKAGIKIYSNYSLIQQVVEILMDNAVTYTNEGGSITVHAYAEKNAAVINIQNTGSGIAAEDIGKVFDRFYRGDKARVQQEGNYGLGLSIAKSVVQKLNGVVSVQSNAERTCFTVRIPGRKNRSA